MTVAEVITEVRTLVQDTRAPYRYSDAVLLRFLNQTVRRMATIRPDLFTVIGEIPTVAGTVIQRIPTTAIRLVEIYNVQGGGVSHRGEQGRTRPDSPDVALVVRGGTV